MHRKKDDMNNFIIEEIAKELDIKIKQVETVLKLLEEGNTIPFIARYRKEVTGNLDEEQIRKINEYYLAQLFYMFEMQTAIIGELYNINAFNQPGVEGGKNATYALVGRKGYENTKKEMENALAKTDAYII